MAEHEFDVYQLDNYPPNVGMFQIIKSGGHILRHNASLLYLILYKIKHRVKIIFHLNLRCCLINHSFA